VAFVKKLINCFHAGVLIWKNYAGCSVNGDGHKTITFRNQQAVLEIALSGPRPFEHAAPTDLEWSYVIKSMQSCRHRKGSHVGDLLEILEDYKNNKGGR